MSGRELARVLREQWRMETEMTQGSLVLAMTSLCDDEDALDRLAQALLEIDRRAVEDGNEKAAAADNFQADLLRLQPAPACTMADAAGQEAEMVPLSQASGRICAEYLYFYPPGIPILAPGEIITRSHLDLLACAGKEGAALYRSSGHTGIRCLRE
jgi:arginine/lysine/ornithine decarboxylase